MRNDRIHPGMIVLSADGLAVGRVRSADPDGATVSGAGMQREARRIDVEDIAGVADGEVVLRVRADELAETPAEPPAPFAP